MVIGKITTFRLIRLILVPADLKLLSFPLERVGRFRRLGSDYFLEYKGAP
jgi:hypothetical protein